MPVITVQLGQCGNQLGSSWFNTLATELGKGEYGVLGVEEWFRPLDDAHAAAVARTSRSRRSATASHAARSVLIDMEPKVVNSVVTAAASSGSWWAYPPEGRQLCMASGAGNNWAHGFHGYGPSVHHDALELVRQEAEACDVLGGFMLLQSMAGGTGAGLGTYIAKALRDEFPTTHALNCCVWPYETGEVIVQPYNSLLTLGHLTGVSDGIILLENEALHATAQRLHRIPRPTFKDMNCVASTSLACLLLPSRHRSVGGPSMRPQLDAQPGGGIGGRGCGTPKGAPACARAARMLSELLGHCAAHPGHRLMSLRALPQMPAASVDFTTFTWPAITKRLRQMAITGATLEEGLNWSVSTLPQSPASGVPGPQRDACGGGGVGHINKSVASWLVLRGQGSGEADVAAALCDPGLYSWWCVDPLAVTSHPAQFARYDKAAALLAADQAAVRPCGRMLERARAMFGAGAFVHQYEAFGLGRHEFHACFDSIDDMQARYATL